MPRLSYWSTLVFCIVGAGMFGAGAAGYHPALAPAGFIVLAIVAFRGYEPE